MVSLYNMNEPGNVLSKKVAHESKKICQKWYPAVWELEQFRRSNHHRDLDLDVLA